MIRQRPARSLLVPAIGGIVAAALATGCGATGAVSAAGSGASGHALPGPVTAFVAPAGIAGAALHAVARPAGPSPAQAVQTDSLAPSGATASSTAGPASAGQASANQAGAVGSPAFVLNLTIVTGDMIGRTEYPAYIPSDMVLPANSTVVVTVTNFDDATPLPKGSEIYSRAQGIVGGTFSVTPIDPKDPNGAAGPTRILSSLDPADVSHTLTVPGLGLNVPIAPHARVTFTIHTGAPGTYTWHCMDPCGAGASGWGTAMAAGRGYMEGRFTVA
jgi:hypothetical protein